MEWVFFSIHTYGWYKYCILQGLGLQEAGLTAKPSKRMFGANKCKYLDDIVGNGVVETDRSKEQAVLDFPVLTTKNKCAHSWAWRRFIPNYASLAWYWRTWWRRQHLLLKPATRHSRNSRVQVFYIPLPYYGVQISIENLCCRPTLLDVGLVPY